MSKESKGRKPGALSRCLRFAGRRKPLVFASMALAVLSAAASFVPYVAIYFMIRDAVEVYPNLAAVDVSAMTGYAGLAVAGIVVDVGCYLAALLCSHAAAFDAQYRTKLDIAAHLGRIPLGHVARLGTGRISKVMDESVGGIEQFIGHSIPDLAATAAAPVVLVALLFVFDWRFGVATLAAVAVACVVQFSGYADKRVMASMGRYQEVKEQMGNAAVEYVRGMRVVKAFGQTARSFRRLADAIKDYTGLSLDVTLFFRNSMPGFTAVLNNAYLFVLPVGILLAPGAQDWPTFVLSLVFYLLFVHSISSVFTKILYVSEDGMLAQANIDRIDSVLGIGELPVPEAPKTPKDASVSLRNVTFSYEGDAEPALRDVSLEVPAGTACAVVGPSGSGKSTLANLVARFWDVDSGQVLVGGVDVREMSQDELMGNLSLVFQDSHLFRESIADNIRRGRPGATDDEVVEAAKAAQADAFISGLPHGYATVVGSEGVHLSGGEKQRIAIARSIISDAPIVVLDEATAFSDPENEHLIQKAFERIMAGKTVIMIAHRLSTVVDADKIVVLDGGRKVEEGTHEELLAASGAYARMWGQYTEALDWGIESASTESKGAAPEASAVHADHGGSVEERGPAEAFGGQSRGRVPWLQRAFNLTDQGYAGLKRSALACTLSDLALMIPFVCTVAAFAALVGTLAGEPFDANALWAIFAVGIAGAIVVFIASRNDYKKTYVAAYTESESIRLRLADHLRKLPMSFFNRRDTTDVADRIMGDVTAQESMLSSTLPQLIAGTVSTAVICVMLAFFDWRLACCAMVTLPLSAAVIALSRRREKRLFERQNRVRLDALARVQDYLEGIKDIRACRAVGKDSAAMEQAMLELKRVTMRVELAVDVSVSLASAILRSGVGLTACVGAMLLASGGVDFMVLLMFLLIVSRVYSPILALVSQLPNLLNLSTKTARIKAVMDEPEAKGSAPADVSGHSLSFQNVRFGYGDEEVLHGISFDAQEGKVTALVGPSGSGKSTCAQLAAKFWEPNSGRILCSGKDIAGFSEESWLAHVSIVFQDVILFDDTVANNIRIGREGASDEEVAEAARTAHCLEFIEKLPQGFDTMLGENGASLSGGERQRLSIARALLKDAPVVLLDEATASLDPENETLIQRAVGTLCTGKTVVVIAHRLRTVANADKIVVLDDGRVAEEGSHKTLLAEDGLYARLWRLQQESSSWTAPAGWTDADNVLTGR
ncbi:MAG: ABC transporter ATP-binding protein [Collinsella sp.]|nr:ABC transporter ATP-binding protein [Collinsella sp.]